MITIFLIGFICGWLAEIVYNTLLMPADFMCQGCSGFGWKNVSKGETLPGGMSWETITSVKCKECDGTGSYRSQRLSVILLSKNSPKWKARRVCQSFLTGFSRG